MPRLTEADMVRMQENAKAYRELCRSTEESVAVGLISKPEAEAVLGQLRKELRAERREFGLLRS